MKLIKKLARMGEDALKGRLVPFTIKKVERALESAIDTVDAGTVEREEKIERLLAKIAKGEVGLISDYVGVKLEIEEQANEREILEDLKTLLNSDVPKNDPADESEDAE